MKKLLFSLLVMMSVLPSFSSNNQPHEGCCLMNVDRVAGKCPLLIANFVQYTKAQISLKLNGGSLDKSDSKKWLYTTAGYIPVGKDGLISYDAISFEFNSRGTLKEVFCIIANDSESNANDNLKSLMASFFTSDMFTMKDNSFYHKNGRGYVDVYPVSQNSNGQYTWGVSFHYLK